MFLTMSSPPVIRAASFDRDDVSGPGFGNCSDKKRGLEPFTLSGIGSMGGRNFRRRFPKHGRFRSNCPAKRRASRAVSFQWDMAKEKKLGSGKSSLQTRVGFHSRRGRGAAAGGGESVCPGDCECGRYRRLLDQSTLFLFRPLATACLLSELESAAVSPFTWPVREADRSRNRQR